MRILITGSSGQLGAEIARQLSAQHDIIGIDRVYVIERARRRLGYQPRYNFQEYLRTVKRV